MSKRRHLVWLILGSTLYSGVARAGGAAAAAQAAFDEGRRLEEAGDYDAAAARFEESERLDPALGTTLNLATCYERAGRLASAWHSYLRSVDDARAAGEEKRAQRAQQLADALRPRLSTIAFDVAGDLPADTTILIDGAAVDRAQWGAPAPIDGGNHRVEARAAGRKTWSTELQVAPSAQQAMLHVPALDVAPAGESAVPAAHDPAAPPTTTPATPAKFWTAPRIAGVAAAGAGLVAVGVGTVFGLQARSKWSDRQAQCAFDYCTTAGYSLGDDAKIAAQRANVAFAIGGAGLAAGAVLYFLVPSLASSPTSVAAVPAPGGGAVFLRRTF